MHFIKLVCLFSELCTTLARGAFIFSDQKTINELNKKWTIIEQEVHFEASFLNDQLKKAYLYPMVQIKFFSFLRTIAIINACLGLLGIV